jgi:hypothetical protein
MKSETYPHKVLFIKGIIEKEQKKEQSKNHFYNFMNSKQLEQAFNESSLVLPFWIP